MSMTLTQVLALKAWEPTAISQNGGTYVIDFNWGSIEPTGFLVHGHDQLNTSVSEIVASGTTSANQLFRTLIMPRNTPAVAALMALIAGIVGVAFTMKAQSQSPPVANFSASTLSGNAPLTVQFTSSATNAASYSYDFGDGSTSTSPNPRHIFTNPGSYDVVQTVTNVLGETDTHSVTIKVTQQTIPEIVAGGVSSPLGFSWPQPNGSPVDTAIWTASTQASDDQVTVQSGAMMLQTGSSGSYPDHHASATTVESWQSAELSGTIDVPGTNTSGLSISLVDDSGTAYTSLLIRAGDGSYTARCGNKSIDRTKPNARPQVKQPPWSFRFRYEQQGDKVNMYFRIWDASSPEDPIYDSILWNAAPIAVGTPLHVRFAISNGGNTSTISALTVSDATPLPAPAGYTDVTNVYGWQTGLPNSGNNQIALIVPQIMASLGANAVLHLDDLKDYIIEQPMRFGGLNNGQTLNGGTAQLVRKPGEGRGPYAVLAATNFVLVNYALTGSRYDPSTGTTIWTYNHADEEEAGVLIDGGSGQQIIDPTIKGVGGDGIQGARFSSVKIRNLTVDGAGRQGFSYNYGDGWDVDGFDIQHCGRSASDGEPYSATDYVYNVSIKNGRMAHFYNFAFAGQGSGTKKNMTVKNVVATGGLGLGVVSCDGIDWDSIDYNWQDSEVTLGSNLRGLLLFSSGALNLTNSNITLKVGPQTTMGGTQVMVPITGTSGLVDSNVMNNHNGGVVGVSQSIMIGPNNSGNMTIEHL